MAEWGKIWQNGANIAKWDKQNVAKWGRTGKIWQNMAIYGIIEQNGAEWS